jgi:hypothetical protein
MNRRRFLIAQLTILGVLSSSVASSDDQVAVFGRDLALQPATILINPWKNHVPPTTRQGVPGIERTAKGRLWVIYGRDVESPRNYQVLKFSDDDGRSWSSIRLMIMPQNGVRAMSPAIWIDPQGKLWVFWGQSFGLQDGRYGIFAISTDEPDAENPHWSAPRRLGDGIMLNKPTVLSNGDWLLTSSIWKADDSIRVYASTDQGKTFALRGTANIPDPKMRGPDEPMIVERKDGSLWMVVRVQGLGQTVSHDRGKTWTPVEKLAISHPTSRFFVRRLNSGALLLVKHGGINEKAGREKLMAFVSDDDGATWTGGLMLDERDHITYPDGVQSTDGTIYVVYDRDRTPDGIIQMAVFKEDDVRAGSPTSGKATLKHEIDRLPNAE